MHPSKIARKRQRRQLPPVKLQFYLEYDNGLLIVMPIRDPNCKGVIYDAVSIEMAIPKGRRSTLVSIKVPTSHARVTDTYLRQLCRAQSAEVAETEFLRFFHGIRSREPGNLSSSTVWKNVLKKADIFLRGLRHNGSLQ